MKYLLLLFAALLPSMFALAQIEYINAPPIDAEIFVQRLTGNGVQVFNAELMCPDKASGFFKNGDSTNLGMKSGIVLTTGSTEIAFDPNTVGNAGVNNGGPGYAPLEDWPNGYNGTFNACVLEFDFVPYDDSINLNYIFGSEEYPEYVGSSFNDIFGILIQGLPEYPENMSIIQKNIAIIPTSPGINVAINFLNFASYSQFYQENTDDPYIQYDGQTVRLPAKAKVTPCNTYHLSIAIADVSDGIYDSGLFLEEGSFSSKIPQVVSASSNFDENIHTIFEGGSEGIFTFAVDNLHPAGELFPIVTTPLGNKTFDLVLGGTATIFEDYTLDTENLIFYPKEEDHTILFPEQATQQLKVTPIADNIEEEAEYLTIGFYSNCSQQYLSIDTLWIEDPLQTGIEEGGTICIGESFQLSVFGGDENMTYQWTPSETLDNPTIANPIASPTETTTYIVTVTGENGYEAQHGVTIYVSEEALANLTASSNSVCPFNAAVLSVPPYQPNYTYTFYNENGDIIAETNFLQILVYPEITTTYTVVVTNSEGCTATDEITIEVEDLQLELAENFIVCENEVLSLQTLPDLPNVSYEWTPSIGLSDSHTANPTITTTETRTYTLTTISTLGCMDTIQTTIEVAEDCVYPGDADDNGKVNMFDLFAIGQHFGKSGFARNTISNKWQGFGVYDWSETQANGKNIKYIDCNGDGEIGFKDTVALVYNFDLHQKSGGFTKGVLGDPELQFIPNFEVIGAGKTLELEVWIGSDENPVSDLYAIAFETFFDTHLIDGNAISMDYKGSGLGTVGVDLLTTSWVNEVSGRINVSMSKIGGQGITGKIYLLTIRMKTQDIIGSENFSFNITDFGATHSDEEEILVNVDNTPTIEVNPEIVGIEALSAALPYQLYPSFTQDGFYLNYTLQKNPSIQVTLFDLSGQQLGIVWQRKESSLGSFQQYIDLKERNLAAGVYLIEVQIEGRTYREKIVFY
ncbi:MAG: choice-of-anchor L domain-containing protein [Chitinophagales bacterium]